MSTTWREDAPHNLVALVVARCLLVKMDAGRWTEIGLLTGASNAIDNHPRLRRSLRFGDDDYDGCVFDIVGDVLGQRPEPADDPWAALMRTKQPPLTLHQKFPNLVAVTDYLDLPTWLHATDKPKFDQLMQAEPDATMPDATMPDGTVLSAAEAAAIRLGVGEMKRQIDRIRRDHAEDPEAAVGQAKELIESTCKTILGMTGDAEASPLDLGKLITRTMRHLGIDPSQVTTEGDPVQVRAAKRLLGGVASILTGTGELRNARGTGHGRSGAITLDPALGHLAVGVVAAAVVYLVEVYEQLTADGRRVGPSTVRPATSSIAPPNGPPNGRPLVSQGDAPTGPAANVRRTRPNTGPLQPAARAGTLPVAKPAGDLTLLPALCGGPPTRLRLGQQVRHDTFGDGLVEALQGQADTLVVVVKFANNIGVKRLLLRYAPLTALD